MRTDRRKRHHRVHLCFSKLLTPHFCFSGSFLFIETSPMQRGDSVGLVSGFLKPNETVCLQFWYHMHGSHIGNLSVIARTNNTERLVWQQRGEQGDAWLFGQTTLNDLSRFQVMALSSGVSIVRFCFSFYCFVSFFVVDVTPEYTHLLSHKSIERRMS